MKKSCIENGRSMIEMLGVLAIIGVLSVGGIAGYSKAMYRYRLNKTIEEITQIAGNIRAFFAPQKSYAGLDNYFQNNADIKAKSKQLLQKAKLVPDEMWKEGTSITMGDYYLEHPFDSGIDILSVRKISTDACLNDSLCNNQAFYMRLWDIPLEACVDLLTQDWSEMNVTGAEVINTGHAQTSKMYRFAIPMDMSDAIKACHSDDGFTRINIFFDVDVTQGNWARWIADTRAALDAM